MIETAYVNGVFVARDETAVRAGFHPDFVLSVLLDDGKILVVTLGWRIVTKVFHGHD